MKAGMEQQMIDELGKTSAEDMWPGYDREDEWAQLSRRIPRQRKIPVLPWAVAAGLAAVGIFTFLYIQDTQDTAPVTVSSSPAWLQMPADTTPKSMVEVTTRVVPGIAPANHKQHNPRTVASEIYNGTPCPIAVRINQVKSCPNVQPEPISNSSTLQPAGTAQINYEDHETVASNCSVTVKEIEIKSIATGDVILLDANSTPATVQDAFRIMTREREGKILAGAFDHDCRTREKKLNLALDNRRGRITLE
jgi:hypothetical protein